MKDISILGSGWLGLPLAQALQQQGYQVKASSRSDERLSQISQSGLSAHYFDIEKEDSDIRFLQADILIINITSKNILAFERLIKSIESSAIKQVLFISSTSVYRDSDDLQKASITEDNLAALKPCDLLTIENLFRSNSHFETTIIRFAGLIGYQRHPGRFFLQANTESNTCKAIKNPDACVNMIHRDDCLGVIAAVFKAEYWGEVINACASHHPKRRDFYNVAIQHLAAIPASFDEQGGSIGKVVDNNKVKTLLGYSFKHDDLLDFESMPFNEH